MTLERACDDSVKANALRAPVLAQALTLLLSQRAELVVIGCAQRGLAVSH